MADRMTSWLAARMAADRRAACRIFGIPPRLLGVSPAGRIIPGRYRLRLGEYRRRQLARRRRRR